MRALLSAAAVVAALTGAASAEPVKLDEAKLGDVAAGIAFGPGPIDIDIGVANAIFTPTSVVNDLDVTNQIGGALAINTNAVIAALASNVSGNGAAMGAANFNAGPPPMP
jgi:hypothetical protein